jgi:hypothetical protein
MPVPEVGDFRVDIGNEGMRLLQEQYEASYNARLNAAMSDVSKRLIEGLAHVSDRLTPDESGERKMFQRTMLEKLAETVSSVRALNITRNEALDKMAAMTEKAIENVDIDFLKENETARDADGSWRADVGFYSDEQLKIDVQPKVESLADWPDWLAQSVTMLALADINQTVPSVGKRTSKDSFWVYV